MEITRYDETYIPEKTKKSQNIKQRTKEESPRGTYIHDVHTEEEWGRGDES